MIRNGRGPTTTHARLRALAAALLLLAAAWTGGAPAASLQVAPTSLTLQGRQNADVLWLSNSGKEPVQVQLRMFRWTQSDGAESLDPSHDLVVSPAMQTLQPGEKQVVRIIRTAPQPVAAETTYRVIVDELPSGARDRQGLQFVLRYSVPIFVVPDAAAGAPTPAPALDARLLGSGDGEAILEVRNRGTQHAQIADLAYGKDAASAAPVTPGLLGYALAGQTMRWPLKSPASRFTGGIFVARINGAAALQPLALSASP
ncbi:fimbrial biogenesis chaperone [Luteimonas aquatica]|uniref:fimbrial biogenesis chaperone n=1 Tax=Luteimonas aquatica TaxID=450364 RepID=UPI001F56B8C5|nr:fimbria/pilus periplasmic chaperone [Luteimonas aquatica]